MSAILADTELDSVRVALERWPLKAPFSIARITFYDSILQTVTITAADGAQGRGECEPHESDESLARQLIDEAGLEIDRPARPRWLAGLTRDNLLERLPRSPQRNAIDCALWDLEAKRSAVRATTLAGYSGSPVPVMPTLGIDTPDVMAVGAGACRGAKWLKVKLGANDGLDEQRLEAVAGAAPQATLLLDANGGWTPERLAQMLPLATRHNVRIIEQPMRPEFDDRLPKPPGDILFCADESCLDRASLPSVRRHYQYINIKLDKTGGLTEALALRREAEAAGLGVMVGMMSGSSLSIAPAFVLAQGLEVVDLELGFMTRDREPAMTIVDHRLLPPDSRLWG